MKKTPLSKAIKLFAFFAIPLFGISCSFTKNANLAYANSTNSAHSTLNNVNHEGYTEWYDDDSLPDTAGDYILETDVTLTNTWTVPTGDDMNLCLNGHVIQGNSTFGLIQVPSGANFTLTECNKTAKTYFTYNHNALWQYIPSPTPQQIDAARNIDDILGDISTNPLVSGSSVISFTGGALTKGKTGFGGAVNVAEGGVFTMDSGNIVGNESNNYNNSNQGGGVYTYGTFNFNGGYIAGCGSGLESNQGSCGGVGASGVNATFTQDGGTIAYCYCKNQTGGGVRITTNATYNLVLGSIVHCSANYVGGVHINGAKFNMTGGSMSYNTSVSDNGTIAVGGTDSVVRLVGGSVCNNTHINAGGVATNVNGVTVGGSFVVDNNFLNDGTESNFYLKTGAKLNIGTGEDAPTSLNVGITSQTAPTGDANVILTSNGTDDDKAWFTSDNINYHLEFNTDHLELAVHKHDDIVFDTNWAINNALPTTAGNYFLSTDVTLSSAWTVPTGVTNLCLCGHVIRQTVNASVMKVGTGTTLGIYDDEETPHYFTYSSNSAWSYIENPTTEQIDVAKTLAQLDEMETIPSDTIVETSGGVITGGKGTNYNNVSGKRTPGSSNLYVGGGVIVEDGGAFTLNEGTLVGNIANGNNSHESEGGGVVVFPNSTFTMKGDSAIVGNYAAHNGHGGGVCSIGGTFNFNGGRISYNYAPYGGGLNIGGEGSTWDDPNVVKATFTMSNGEISHNSSPLGGALQLEIQSTFTMTNGIIANNIDTQYGAGGVRITTDGIFNLSGGEISNNKVLGTSGDNGFGGAVRVDHGEFNMTGGKISGNYAGQYGGGVAAWGGNGAVKITGGEISGNDAKINGSGVHKRNSSLTLGGTAKITGNTKTVGDDEVANNLYINANQTIDISEEIAPADGMAVGISTETTPVRDAPVKFTTNGSAEQLEYFSSDNSAYSVNFNDGTSGDEHFELKVPDKIQVTKPAADTTTFTYTGQPQTYNIPASELYTVTGNVQTSAGTHTVTVSLKDKDNYEWADGSTDDLTYNFVIGVAENAITDLKLDGWTYGDTPNTPTCTASFGGDKVVYTYSTSPDGEFTSTVPTNAGTYYVKAEVAATSDYKKASQVVSFTIAKKQETKPTPTNLHYDKDTHTYVADPSDPYTVKDEVTISGNKEIHNITVSLKDKVNCCWADGSVDDLTFTKEVEIVSPSCNLHWIMLGILILEIILFIVLYLVFKFKLATIISLGAGTVASIVFFIVGKCNLCYIFAAINIALCIAGLVYVLLKRRNDENKEEKEPVKETATPTPVKENKPAPTQSAPKTSTEKKVVSNQLENKQEAIKEVKKPTPTKPKEEKAPIKVVKEVSATEVNKLMSDDLAEAKTSSSKRIADKTKRTMINIDTLCKYFKDGETVTLKEIKKRVPKFEKKATYYKVCARGTLDRKLIVDADNFSIEAKKMILLTGGKVIVSVEKEK